MTDRRSSATLWTGVGEMRMERNVVESLLTTLPRQYSSAAVRIIAGGAMGWRWRDVLLGTCGDETRVVSERARDGGFVVGVSSQR
mmetsp:Transcript_49484/g.149124  ORF Transcript_49484/g.149124 Transcript_49484/m.149124 type:complete len:85 (+) Transcript_49484:298-552(+)